MLTEEQERWLTALESGEYKQGSSILHSVNGSTDSFCCLGIACHLFKEELGLDIERRRVVVALDVVMYNGDSAALPLIVQKHLMLRSNLGGAVKGETLSYLNDNSGKTFEEIATIIRSNPSNYFKEIDNHVD